MAIKDDAPEELQPRGGLEKAVEEFLALDSKGASVGEARAKIIGLLPVSNKYVKVGNHGVARAYSFRWKNDFLSIQPWSDKLSALEDVH
jgi:hypothetical protein